MTCVVVAKVVLSYYYQTLGASDLDMQAINLRDDFMFYGHTARCERISSCIIYAPNNDIFVAIAVSSANKQRQHNATQYITYKIRTTSCQS